MFDTLALNLTSAEVEGVNFMEEVPPYLSITGFHRYRYEQDVITGDLNGLRVSVTPPQCKDNRREFVQMVLRR